MTLKVKAVTLKTLKGNISVTVADSDMLSMDQSQKTTQCDSDGHMADDVT